VTSIYRTMYVISTNKASTKRGGNPTLYDRTAVERRRAPCGLVTDPSPRAIDPKETCAAGRFVANVARGWFRTVATSIVLTQPGQRISSFRT
jgi:hypothetical protein